MLKSLGERTALASQSFWIETAMVPQREAVPLLIF